MKYELMQEYEEWRKYAKILKESSLLITLKCVIQSHFNQAMSYMDRHDHPDAQHDELVKFVGEIRLAKALVVA